MRNHALKKPDQCKICDNFFSVKSNYEKHMMMHISDKPYQCMICDTKYKHKNSLITHMKVNNNNVSSTNHNNNSSSTKNLTKCEYDDCEKIFLHNS